MLWWLIHVIACIRIIFHCMARPQFVHQLMGILIVSTFLSVLWPFIYKFLSGYIFLFLWGAYLGETKMSGSCQGRGEWGREMLVEGHELSVLRIYLFIWRNIILKKIFLNKSVKQRNISLKFICLIWFDFDEIIWIWYDVINQVHIIWCDVMC